MSGVASVDLAELRRAIGLFLTPGYAIELRAPNCGYDGTVSGYFTDANSLLQAAREIDKKAPSVYVTLNPVPLDLLARANNRLKSKTRDLTQDAHVVRRRWLLLDFDPLRPSGISSTDAEHQLALDAAAETSTALLGEGWPLPVLADSGNGAHLLYRIDEPNDAETAALIRQVLKGAETRFSSPGVDCDTSVFNASRISKLYGTVSRKGDATQDRPHRTSRILSMPDELRLVSRGQLEALAGEAPAEQKAPATKPAYAGKAEFSLERWLVDNNVPIHRGPHVKDGTEIWVLDACPFNPSHRAPDAALFRKPGGALAFRCLHKSCGDRDWAQFRAHYEPVRVSTSPRSSGPPPMAPIEELGDKNSGATAAEVEARVDAALVANDLEAALRLAPELARLRHVERVVLVARLRGHFGRKWPSRDFERAMKESEPVIARPLAEPDDSDESADPGGVDLLHQPYTDAGNGERLVAVYGSDIRYCVEMKRWLIWDGTRWALDELSKIRQMAKDVARRLHAQGKSKEMPAATTHARASESYAAISAAIGCAASEMGIPISVNELDQHAYLLNCPNGVVDLRRGSLMPHSRDFLITKLCPVPYKPEALCPRFLGFVEWAMGGNPEGDPTERTTRLVGFLQRALGYALTADVSEKAVFVLHGERGNNGKTTLLTLFRDLLGKDYSGQIVIDTIMSMKTQDATTRADLADLRGVRLVMTSEVEKEHKLNEGKIKYITAGMGSIKSCRKYENPIEFIATHKLFMDCNHRPVVRGVDDAIWRRLKLIPFEVTVAKEDVDLQLPAKLREELPGVLAWAVRGCIAWRAHGLGDPPEIGQSLDEWREHDDPLKEFVEDMCDLNPEDFVKVADLNVAYEWWAKQAREKYPLGREALNERLQAKGLRQNRSRRIDGKQARTWEGLALKPEVVARLRKLDVFTKNVFAGNGEIE